MTHTTDMIATATYYMNEIGYLVSTSDTEKMQGRKFVSKLGEITESLEMTNCRQSFIDLCWSKFTNGLTKFK